MKDDLTRCYGCALCSKGVITYKTTEEIPEHAMLENFNCDLSTYSDPVVTGGKLFKIRPRVPTVSACMRRLEEIAGTETNHEKPPAGGICSECLKNDVVKKLMAAGAIVFDENPGTFRRYTH